MILTTTLSIIDLNIHIFTIDYSICNTNILKKTTNGRNILLS